MTTQLNEFGKKVFLQLAKEEKNVVVSPLSIFSALSMLSFGASGMKERSERVCCVTCDM